MDCGPEYALVSRNGRSAGIKESIDRTLEVLDQGGIVSIKGLGGFFMACDALNPSAVNRLRSSKHREGKPFAVMFADIEQAGKYCEISDIEASLLASWRRPIVILREKIGLAPGVSNGFPTIGAMLPYMPVHYLLFEKIKTPAIVLTSGNLAEEPIIIDNRQAEEILGPVSDAVLHYNRDIRNRTDDSVAMVVSDRPRVIRRSRGYVPNPVRLGFSAEGIFAAGAELVNCFCLGRGNQAIMSQHIGDLKNYETFEFYRETFERFRGLFRLEPGLVACDMHPDYLSTRFAQSLGMPTIAVQHHHAHIASVMAEHGIEEKIIGVSFDGTGLGDDRRIWGSEFLICDLEGYHRVSHLEYTPMPGGDMATHEPWRMAVSFLYRVYGRDLVELDLPFLRDIDPSTLDLVIASIEKNINCPLSSGAGRLFDAAAALLDLCTRSSFHAEAPMRLESVISPGISNAYPFDDGNVISTIPTFEAMVNDLLSGTDPGWISARFHNTVFDIITGRVKKISRDTGIRTMALSGGTFQNRYLSERIEQSLLDDQFKVLIPTQLPVNDGGIALGQLAVAAKKREAGNY
jgi:hydrogenase maturation protein HypF